MAAPVARTSDYVRDSQLRTTISPGLTLHTYFVSTPGTRRRRARTEEIWRRRYELGNGTFGRVWLEQCDVGPRQGQLRAVKSITKGQSPLSSIDYSRELEAMAKFSHDEVLDCFVRFFGWYEDHDTVFLAMEYFEHGDLDKHMTIPFSEMEASQITMQLAEGNFFMHDNHFAHRDLKPSNILVVNPRPDWWVKIGDFGISKRAHTGTVLHTVAGTPGYMAPEVIGLWPLSERPPEGEEQARGAYSASVDIWALGEIIVRMITQGSAFRNPAELFDYVVHEKPFPHHIFQNCDVSDKCCDFVEKIMARSPLQRLDAKEAVAHPWVLRPSSRDGSPRSSIFLDASAIAPPPPTSHPNELTPPDDGSLAWSTINTLTDIQPPSALNVSHRNLAPGIAVENAFINTDSSPSPSAPLIFFEKSFDPEKVAHPVNDLEFDVPASATETLAAVPKIESSAGPSPTKLRALNQLQDGSSVTEVYISSNSQSGSPRSISPPAKGNVLSLKALSEGEILYDFVAQRDDEMTVAIGDKVVILDDTTSDDWWQVRCLKNGQEGFVPSSYIEATSTDALSPGCSSYASTPSMAAQNGLEEIGLTKVAIGASKEPQQNRRENRRGEGNRKSRPKPDSSKVRTWTDRTRTFSVEAQFLGLKDGKLRLHKMNGIKIAVPISKMSPEDVQYAKDLTGILSDYDKPIIDQHGFQSQNNLLFRLRKGIFRKSG